ncbi:hypothetical protein [Leifsonia sp. 22587]|uniref:hypothetical protein n=1 Tax=Leifsonia sp. 22587 TaxID=3453946 RepID=UPI003F867D12
MSTVTIQRTEDPGRTLGVVGLVLAIVFPIAGLVVSLVARNRSREAGFANGLAKAGVIVSIVIIAASLLISFAIIALGVAITGDPTLMAP